MEWRGLRIPIIILALLIGLILFFGGQFLYNKYNIEKPLEELIMENKSVQQVTIDEKADITVIEIKLKDEGINSAELYQEIYFEASKVLKNQSFRISFVDNPDQQLYQLWQRSQYYIHQAIMQGNFPEMVDNIEKMATEAQVNAEVYVSGDNIFIQLFNEHTNKSLIRIVARQNYMVTGQVANIGGEASDQRN
ncbi:hypothetical protein V6C27_04500 [Peptococcaceae bacterium 1198_IL3148]